MCAILLPLDSIFMRCMTNQIDEKPFRLFRSIVIGCHHSRDALHAWIDVVINSQTTESHRDAHWVVNIELYALRLPFGMHHEPPNSHQFGNSARAFHLILRRDRGVLEEFRSSFP